MVHFKLCGSGQHYFYTELTGLYSKHTTADNALYTTAEEVRPRRLNKMRVSNTGPYYIPTYGFCSSISAFLAV